MASCNPEDFLPTPMTDRVIARCIDLWRTGVVLVIALVPASCTEYLSQTLITIGPGPGPQFDLGDIDLEILPLVVFGLIVAACYEPLRLMRKGSTSGKTKRGMELHVFGSVGQRCSMRRTVARYFVSAGACGAVAAEAIAVLASLGAELTLWAVVVPIVVSPSVVWLSVLMSARLRTDRRGWHDVLAGTVLVSTRVTAPCRGSVLGRRG